MLDLNEFESRVGLDLGDVGADQLDDIGFPGLEHGQPGGMVRNKNNLQRFKFRGFAVMVGHGLHGVVLILLIIHPFERSGTDGLVGKTGIPHLFPVFLGHDGPVPPETFD